MAAAGLDVEVDALVGGRGLPLEPVDHVGGVAHVPAEDVAVAARAAVQEVAVAAELYLNRRAHAPLRLFISVLPM